MLLTKEQRTKDFTVSRAEPAGFPATTTTDVFPDTKIYIYITAVSYTHLTLPTNREV